MAKIRIVDLTLRTVIGVNGWERQIKQDVVINVEIDYNAAKACRSDKIQDAVDYKDITKKIISVVEESNFFLIEKLAAAVMRVVLANPQVRSATVRVDKPNALRFARSVSVEISSKRRRS